MRFKLSLNRDLIHNLSEEYGKPVIGRRHHLSVVGSVPSFSGRANLLEEFSIAVKYINFCACIFLQSDNIPMVVYAIAVWRKEVRIVNQGNVLNGEFSTRRAHRYRMRSGPYVFKNATVGYKRPVIELVEEQVRSYSLYGYFDRLPLLEGARNRVSWVV